MPSQMGGCYGGGGMGSRGLLSALALGIVAVVLAAVCCLELGSKKIAAVLEEKSMYGEEAKIKKSLRQITSRLLSQDRQDREKLSVSDRDQLGALVDAAVARHSSSSLLDGARHPDHGGDAASGRDLLRWVDQAGKSEGDSIGGDGILPMRLWDRARGSRSASRKGWILDTLGRRLDGKGAKGGATGTGSRQQLGAAEPTTVGVEVMRHSEEGDAAHSDREKFTAAQSSKMEEAVKAGWKELHEGHAVQAKDSLRQAKFFHRAMLHLMQGSAHFSDNLETPKEIQELSDAIYSSSAQGDSMPLKLQDIMDTHFSKSREKDGSRDSEDDVSEHFEDGSGDAAGGAWNVGASQAIVLPRDRRSRDYSSDIMSLASRNLDHVSHSTASKSGDSNVISFETLLRSQIDHGRHALRKSDTRNAETDLKKASIYLETLQDMNKKEASRHRSSDAAKISSLNLELEILRHAVDNAHSSSVRGRQEQLRRNLQALHAPIQQESVRDYAEGDSGGGGAEGNFGGGGSGVTSIRGLFTKSVEMGLEAANRGNVVRARGKLAEAREYAQEDGYLRPQSQIYGASKAEKAKMAKRSLKLLAQAVIAANNIDGSVSGESSEGRGPNTSGVERGEREVGLESSNVEGARGRDGEEGDDGEAQQSARWEGMYGKDSSLDREANGEREESALSARRARRFQDSRGERHRGRGRRHVYPRLDLADPVRKLSATYREANGESQETEWRDDKAKQQEKERCNTISCLFGFGSEEVRSTTKGRREGINSGLSAGDFGSKATHMHTGLGIARRLKRSGGAKVPDDLSDRQKQMGLSGAFPGSPTAASSTMDAVRLVDKNDKADLAKSMDEAKVAYKKLLQKEIKKEQQRFMSAPMIAIESPTGKSVVAESGKSAAKVLHGSKLTRDLDASDAFEKASRAPQRIGTGTLALINSYLGESKLGNLPAESAPRSQPQAPSSVSAARLVAQRAQPVEVHHVAATDVVPEVRPEMVHNAPATEDRRASWDDDDEPKESLGSMLIQDLGKDLGIDG